ncbi:MAG: D-glycero-alpha-D-manno-heptose-1,7-bisphosphate 7-phosphatase [Niastella sp.]|jgi:D-glycero-D-manno-heptose 1,7-bisphosphate phosphatase|uniref:D-glycero-alpha-D-manno-heptose-1,7-bisphosphate 7-phosphatase n=1 Tax=Niastella sp. TaxID=1869183 RepID=UPI00389A4D4E
MKKAVFIDKDGTLIKNVPYNVDTRLITFEEQVIPALRLLQSNGYQLIIISNQPGIAFGYFSEEAIQQVYQFIATRLLLQGIELNGFYYCPHHVEGTNRPYAKACYCRKPMPGLLLKAAMDIDIDLESSWMIGDILHDCEAGNRAGCATILLNTGNETEWVLNNNRRPDYVCSSWSEAAGIIIQYANAKASVERV